MGKFAMWVLCLLREEHKMASMGMSSQWLRRPAAEGDDFLFNVMTGNASWFYHSDTEMK
jgi:hypothetical protein